MCSFGSQLTIIATDSTCKPFFEFFSRIMFLVLEAEPALLSAVMLHMLELEQIHTCSDCRQRS